MKKLLPAAVLAALAGVNSAQAVHVNSDGLGQVLLYPFYTAEGGQDTYINLVNTTDAFKAVKVRILESMNSQEVLDFNLYLSPYDHWSAVITANADGATITSADTSCTVPNAISNGDTIAFRNFEYAGDSVDGLERTREGYVEVIEMGEVNNATEDWRGDILHVAGVPGDCADLATSWSAGGVWNGDADDGISDAAGGLYGYGVLIDVDEGTDATYDAVALEDFWDPIVAPFFHTDPGNLLPSLNQSTTTYNVLDVTTVLTGDVIGENRDAVSAVLMHDTVSNDYVLEPTVAAGTDWVLTFPTKRGYVDRAEVDPAEAPFQSFWDITTSEACEEFTLRYFDREEGEPTDPPALIDFSPLPENAPLLNPSLCYEANILSFNGSNVLKGSDRSSLNLNLEDGFDNGWAVIDFTVGATRLPLVTDTHEFNGLPVIGFAVQKYQNGDVGGLLSNYAGSVSHKNTRLIVTP